jgi:hypothetical protein
MEAKVIIATVAKTTRENKKIWSVCIEGEEQPAAFCKSAYKAMRFCFLLKKRTEGASISEDCLILLSAEIKEEKAKKAEEANQEGQEKLAEVAQEFIEEHSVDNVLAQQPEQVTVEVEKPKRQRKPRKQNVEQQVIALV